MWQRVVKLNHVFSFFLASQTFFKEAKSTGNCIGLLEVFRSGGNQLLISGSTSASLTGLQPLCGLQPPPRIDLFFLSVKPLSFTSVCSTLHITESASMGRFC